MPEGIAKFNQHAATYDAARRRLIPSFDSFYGAAVEAVALAGGKPKSILDLGAGTGILSAFVLDAFPESEVTVFDGASLMLDQARVLLGTDRVEFVEGDLYGELPAGPWDAVVSALAIHHLTDEGKRHVFAEALRGLRPGGIFVNAEHVLGPTPFLDAEYRRWHEFVARRAGITDEEWVAAEDRMGADHLSPLPDQLEWLSDAGFEDADCLFKDRGLAVMVGRKPA
ncbi:MAG: methyltransferase domain-containing protein [Solirubrobacterales bacterium]